MERLTGQQIADIVDKSVRDGEFNSVISRVEENLLLGFMDCNCANFPFTPDGFVSYFEEVRSDIKLSEVDDETIRAAREITFKSLNRRAEILSSCAAVEFQRDLKSVETTRNVSRWSLMYEIITKPALALSYKKERAFDKKQ